MVNTADVKDDVILGLIAAAEQAEQSADETPESPGTVAAKKGVEKRKAKAARRRPWWKQRQNWRRSSR